MEEFFLYESPDQIFWAEAEDFPANQSAFSIYDDRSTGGLRSKIGGANQSAFSRGSERSSMEEFFLYESPDQILWTEAAGFPAKQSAFSRYDDRSTGGFRSIIGGEKSNRPSLNKRMIEFLRMRWNPPPPPASTTAAETKESERERCFRHMMSERMRREKQKQSYSALRSLLPPSTKSDKTSIVQVAAKEVKELQAYKQELENRNREMEAVLAGGGGGGHGGCGGGKKTEGANKIRLRVANPSSGIDSMVEALKCLKKIGSKTRAIHSKFSAQEFSAVLEIESEVEAAEVEKVVQRTLFEAERKLHFHFPF
ncbi:hypothetical protein U1Q18_030209 [Sarracenia purpurea var. burkii]